MTLNQIAEIANALQIAARGVRCELEELSQLRTPAILHWGLNHFVVLIRCGRSKISIFDPAAGVLHLQLREAGRSFTGVALELSPTPDFAPRRAKSALSIKAWIRFTPAVSAGLGQVLVLSVLLQAYVIASPFYMQLAIDQAALKGDARLLVALAVGFGLFGAFNAGAGLLRNLAMQQVSAAISWDMSLRLFRHMIRLPLPWFQRRRLADTVSRFEAINPIRDLVAGGLAIAAIDGVLALTTLIMMFVFSWQLAVLTLIGVGAMVAVRLLSLGRLIQLGSEMLQAQIVESGRRIETIRVIQTVKAMAGEREQEVQWSNSYSDLLDRKIANTQFQSINLAVNQVFDAIVTTAIIFLAAKTVMAGAMTIGVMYAFLAYRTQFTSATRAVLDQVIQLKLSDIYSHRLADIALTPQEEGIDAIDTGAPALVGAVSVENLAYRYGPHEPLVLRGVNFTVQAGEFIAVTGASGAGKSTLLKILCGLYPATVGEVRIDGRSIRSWGPRALRSSIGVVMQDDELLAGTIAENVAFFDERIDVTRIWQALEQAALSQEVLDMPMKLESFIGDAGGGLSGGQKQRLLLARALYKQPKILILDEATAHLDNRNEVTINKGLKALNITRIIVAHRAETILSADKVFDITSGRYISVPQMSPHEISDKVIEV